uniref:Uncharacterized protein n=1 Tax=Moniliophthora roreri TaxID=221103 RepID=A0A0W0GEZ7_MONRR
MKCQPMPLQACKSVLRATRPEEYSTSDIPDLDGCTYPQLTCTWNNPEPRSLNPNTPPLPVYKSGKSATLHSACTRVANSAQSRIEKEWLTAVEAWEEQLTEWKQWQVAYEEIKDRQILAWLEVVHKAEKEEKEKKKEWMERLRRECEEHAHARNTTPVADEDDGMYETPHVRQLAKGKKGKGVTKFRFDGVEVPSPGASQKHARASADTMYKVFFSCY